MTNKEYADSLRKIADFFERNEQISIPVNCQEFPYYNYDSPGDMARLAGALGSCRKEVTDSFYYLKRNFGHIEFRAAANRAAICKRKVIGKETRPGYTVPEHVVPEREVEIVEWECPEALLPHAQEAAAS